MRPVISFNPTILIVTVNAVTISHPLSAVRGLKQKYTAPNHGAHTGIRVDFYSESLGSLEKRGYPQKTSLKP